MPVSRNITTLQQGICTSSTRPATPYAGQMIFETNTTRTLQYDGTGWIIMSEPPQTLTANLNQFTASNIAKNAAEAIYWRSNGILEFSFRYGITGTGASGDAFGLQMPILPFSTVGPVVGSGFYYDAGVMYVGFLNIKSDGHITLCVAAGGGQAVGASPALVVGNGDIYSGSGRYRMTTRYS